MKTIALVLGLLAVVPANSATLTANVSAVYAPDPATSPDWEPYSCSGSGDSYVECSGNESTATAFASYGLVWAHATAGRLPDVGGQSFGWATASFTDAITFHGPHQNALATFAYQIACEVDFLSLSDGRGWASTGNVCDWWNEPAPPSPIELGVPFQFSAHAQADARTQGGTSRAGDVFGGAWLEYILVTDYDGNPLPNISITSESGTAYRLHDANMVYNPEPATFAPVLMVLLALLCRFIRVRSTPLSRGPRHRVSCF